MRSKLLILLFALTCLFIIFNRNEYARNQYVSDKGGYYLYLPALFIYHDLQHLSFYPAVDSTYHIQVGYSLHDINGNKLNKYHCGVAALSAPAFFVAHAFCLVTHAYPADGFSMPYQLTGLLNSILFVIAGLVVLRMFLLRYFSDGIVAMTLLCIAFGTNLYAYTAFEGSMSHAYSFALFCGLMYLTDTWYASPPKKLITVLLGLVMGLIFIVRPVNIIAFIIPLFWRVNSISSFRERLSYWKKYAGHVLTICFCVFKVSMLQLSYWKLTTGHWLHYAYQGESFDLLHPHIIDGLFSYKKGWFLYTPVALVAFTGFYFLWKKDRKTVPAMLFFFVPMIYVVFSWRTWWYGCGFSCRPMVETLAFLAMPLAALNEHFYAIRGKLKKVLYSSILAFMVVLNIFQTYQYSIWLLQCDQGMNAKQYWYIFGMANPKPGDYGKYLEKE